MSPNAYLRYFWQSLGSVHGELIDWAVESIRLGDVVWDVGANVGVFTFSAARLAGVTGKVLALEADSAMVNLLRRSAAERDGRDASLDILPVAIFSSVGIVKFHLSSQGSAANAVAGFGRFDGIVSATTIPSVTLDWLLDHFAPPNVLKIDVEGAEADVLRGATRLLRDHRPRILIEAGSESADELTRTFADFNYDMFDLRVAPPQRRPMMSPAAETLALPR